MAETKDDLARRVQELEQENAVLRAQAAAAPAPGLPNAPARRFRLSEGDRLELHARGVANIGGRLMTRDMVRELLEPDQADVDLGDREPDEQLRQLAERQTIDRGQYGVDFIYPSVARGAIDPAVAGTPGINGPAATPDVAQASPVPTDGTVRE